MSELLLVLAILLIVFFVKVYLAGNRRHAEDPEGQRLNTRGPDDR